MNILITGANGFIGAHITGELLRRKHTVYCCVRDTEATSQRFPEAHVIPCDFNVDIHIESWLKRLEKIDVVINSVGILQSRGRDNIHAIHTQTPSALFKAAQRIGVKRIIHISALGADNFGETDYATSKAQIDDELMHMNIDSCVLRPALLYGTGSYGGTSVFRALSALPGFIPLIGTGDYPFEPIDVREFSSFVADLLVQNQPLTKLLYVAGPEIVSLKDLLKKLRAWLGFKPAKTISIPLWLISLTIKISQLWNASTVNATSFAMLKRKDMIANHPELEKPNFHFSKFSDVLSQSPSQVQDRWHARLYFLSPILRIVLALFWILSGSLPLIFSSTQQSALGLLSELTHPHLLFYRSCFLDIVLGIWLFSSWKRKSAALLQIATLMIYTFLASIYKPDLWLDPLGPLLKNIPLLLATLTYIAIAENR